MFRARCRSCSHPQFTSTRAQLSLRASRSQARIGERAGMNIVKSPAQIVWRYVVSLSGVGLALGALFFAAALTPTLVPRSYLIQGVLAGTCFAIGYELGILWRWLWRYLELPELSPQLRSAVNVALAVGCFVT